MARNNRKGKGAGPIPRNARAKKQLLQIKANNRKKNLLRKVDSM